MIPWWVGISWAKPNSRLCSLLCDCFQLLGERLADWSKDIDNRLNAGIEYARHHGLVKGGDRIVVVTGSVATSGSTNTIHIFTLEDEHAKLRIVRSSYELGEEKEATSSFGLSNERPRKHLYSVMLSPAPSSFDGVSDLLSPIWIFPIFSLAKPNYWLYFR